MGKTVTGDYNGDGRDDLAVLYDYSGSAIKVWTFLAQPNGGYAAPVEGFRHDTWGDWSATNVHSGDFDGDGRDDVLFWFDYADGRDIAYILKSNTNGTFVAPRAALTISAGSMTYTAMKTVIGDYNGDGRDDIGAMYGYTNGTVKMFTWLTKPDAASTRSRSAGPPPAPAVGPTRTRTSSTATTADTTQHSGARRPIFDRRASAAPHGAGASVTSVGSRCDTRTSSG